MFRAVAKSALAGLLGVVVFLAATFSAVHPLHHSPHSNGGGDGHSCFLCSLAKGQVASVDTHPVTAFRTFCIVFAIRPCEASAPAGWDYRFSPSRAPPSFSSSVVVD